jgi:hypothetical protein
MCTEPKCAKELIVALKLPIDIDAGTTRWIDTHLIRR